MNKISYGLYIVTAKGDKMNGCVSNSFTQVTSSPNRVQVTLNKENFTTELILKSKKFNISILDVTTNFDLIKQFGFCSGKDVDKFENFTNFKLSKNGLPYITSSVNAYLSCEVFDQKDLGSHIMFFADVVTGESLSTTDSLTYAYYHSNIKPQRKVEKVAYVCSVCGYVYEGEILPDDFVCPLCKHDASAFVKQGETKEKVEQKKEKNMEKYKCPLCGYVYEGDNPPEKCPLCGGPMIKEEE